METKTEQLLSNATSDMRTALSRWYRFSNEIMVSSMRLGQPLLDAYFKGLSETLPNLTEMAKKSCEIPETECPPYCVCDMEWDACEGGKISGAINIVNTGKDAVNFKLKADNFRSKTDDSGTKPQLSPDSFNLAPGATQTTSVSVVVGNGFDPGDLYETQVKVRGRYEQCVRLRMTVRRNLKPHCEVEHGEIPRRLVAHNWHDHFQCEELCFEPVRHRVAGTKPKKTDNTASTHTTGAKTKS